MTSRELVINTLEFKNTTERVPRQMWVLPWAENNYYDKVEHIKKMFPSDIENISGVIYKEATMEVGNPYKKGEYTDPWGCKFLNLAEGIVGEVKQPIVAADDEDWDDISKIHIPVNQLSFEIEQVNELCKNSDKFIMADCCPRPFEQLQFIRGTEQLYVDLMVQPPKMMQFIAEMHKFYCELVTKWAKTDVDGILFMDDWGSQNSLLINPTIWKEIFKPMYKDYIDIAHSHGKKAFMHSDGNTAQIMDELISLNLDAINSQIFCIGVENLEKYKGKITFWGEIDRQNLLPYGSIDDITNAVDLSYDKLWKDGGVIAQCEFGPGANPENVYRVFEHWNEIK